MKAILGATTRWNVGTTAHVHGQGYFGVVGGGVDVDGDHEQAQPVPGYHGDIADHGRR